MIHPLQSCPTLEGFELDFKKKLLSTSCTVQAAVLPLFWMVY
jgi:Fe-S cluster assembly iron-binding protein IscA